MIDENKNNEIDTTDNADSKQQEQPVDTSVYGKNALLESDSSDEQGVTTDARKQKTIDKVLSIMLVVLVILLALSLGLRFFVGCRINVSGDSMQPNFHSGDTVWLNKHATAKRGDVVVLYKNNLTTWDKILAEFNVGNKAEIGGEYERLIKRVVALAGDKIWIEQTDLGYVVVIKTSDGVTLREDYYMYGDSAAQFWDNTGKLGNIPYITADHLGNLSNCTSEESAFVVPDGCFYFMGDNRNNSLDSRSSLGALPYSNLYGVVEINQ